MDFIDSQNRWIPSIGEPKAKGADFKSIQCEGTKSPGFCKSLLCSLFYEQTCSRFTRLFVRSFVTMPKIPLYDVLDHANHTFSESSRSKDIYTDIPKCLIHKYTNTNTQIHKYANTAYDKVPERPNMWYIFEKRVVQGYLRLYSIIDPEITRWINNKQGMDNHT